MKCLIVRFSSIGDIVLTTPVIRCLKQQTDSEVHFLTKNSYAGIVEENPFVDSVFSIDKGLKEVLPALKAEEYDWIIDLHNNLRTQQLKIALNTPSESFNKLNIQKWLLVRLGIDVLPQKHIVDRYMETVSHLGVFYDGRGLDYFIPKEEVVDVGQISPLLKPGNYIAFVIAATHATKRLPTEKIVEFCQKIKEPIVLIGGREERKTGAVVLEYLQKDTVFNACGQFSLNASASLVKQSKSVISHDTGLMHIAAAFQKPIISVWGSTVPAFGMYPFYANGFDKNQFLEDKKLSCRPCTKIGFDACPKEHFKCMRDLELF